MRSQVALERLREVLDYNPDTGVFAWKVSLRNRVKPGDAAGSYNQGYRRIEIDGICYTAHRLAWFYMHGVWPKVIDHVNGNRDDNRIDNLRSTTFLGNSQNRRADRGGTSALVGVSWDTACQKWRATIGVRGKSKHLGYFDTEQEAHSAYLKAKARHHTYWATEIAA